MVPDQASPCNLLCSLQFIYPNTAWTLDMLELTTDEKKRFCFEVRTDHEEKRIADIKYNGNTYFLKRIEIYMKSLHRAVSSGCDSEDIVDCEEQYDAEICFYHRSDNKKKWVVTSVWLTPMHTYSLSQDFFQKLLPRDPEKIEGLYDGDSFDAAATGKKGASTYGTVIESVEDCMTKCMGDPDCRGISSNNQKTQCSLADTARTTSLNGYFTRSKKILKSTVLDETWNPYYILPSSKSFYIYRGSFPGGELPGDEVVWIIMANPMPINYDDYAILKNIIYKDDTTVYFDGNVGENYSVNPLNSEESSETRTVYYNDGTYVLGNKERDKFYVKCSKKEQSPIGASVSLAGATDTLPDDLLANSSLQTLYKGPDAPLSTIVTWILISTVLLFLMIHLSRAKEKKQHMFLMVTFAFLFMLFRGFLFMKLIAGTLVSFLFYFFLSWAVKKFCGQGGGAVWGRGKIKFIFWWLGFILLMFLYIPAMFSVFGLVSYVMYDMFEISRNDQYYVIDTSLKVPDTVALSSTVAYTYLISRAGTAVEANVMGIKMLYERSAMKPVTIDALTSILPTDEDGNVSHSAAHPIMTKVLKSYDENMRATPGNAYNNFVRAFYTVLSLDKTLTTLNIVTVDESTGESANSEKDFSYSSLKTYLENSIPDAVTYLKEGFSAAA